MLDEQHHVSSHRLTRLASKLADKAYRGSYVAHQTRQFLARQMRALRGEKSQKEFGELLGKPQSVVSRLEDPNYGKWALQTLFDVANSCDRAVIVRIVDYPTFLRFTSDMTNAAARPDAYKQDVVDSLASSASAMTAMAESMDRNKSGPAALGWMTAHNRPASDQIDFMLTNSRNEGKVYLLELKTASGSSARLDAARQPRGSGWGAKARALQ